MYGPTKNLTILSCNSTAKSSPFGSLNELGYTSFYVCKHPGTLVDILVAFNGETGQMTLFSIEANDEFRELASEFMHSDPDALMEGSDNNNKPLIKIQSFHIIEGDWISILILSDGRIYRSSLEEFSHDSLWTFEQVGAVEGGISAAGWSFDSNILVLITGVGRRILLSREFEPLEEGPVQVEAYGSEEMISIGWGKKETQFHGTMGKSAAITVANIVMAPVEESEDFEARVSWRADGSVFCVSTVDSRAGRRLRVYDRSGSLLSTSEPIEGLECPLAWRPNGSIIATSQYLKAQNKRQVVFFERNGLRHGEFVLPNPNRAIKNLLWSADSNILAIQYKDGEVELWTCSNYHWYLKTVLPEGNVQSLLWDQETLKLSTILNSGHVLSYRIVWDQHVSSSCFAVIDGLLLHLTPLNICNIPPPMSLLQIQLSEVPRAIALQKCGDNLFHVSVALKSQLIIYKVQLSINRSKCAYEIVSEMPLIKNIIQLQAFDEGFIGIPSCGSEAQIFKYSTNESVSIELPCSSWRLIEDGFIALSDKSVVKLTDSCFEFFSAIESTENLGEWISYLKEENVFIVMNEKGWLSVNNNLIMTQATSFSITEQFVLITTHTQQLIFLPRNGNLDSWPVLARAALEAQNGNEELQRRIERQALLVTAVPEVAGVVLQMPRGNLETINPRAMVLSTLRSYLNVLDYYNAYALCRRHRIDLNILHDHSPDLFIKTIGKFVKDLNSVDYLNIFLSSLKDEDITKTKYAGFKGVEANTSGPTAVFSDKINIVSEAILAVLQGDKFNWIDSIMTVYVVQKPPRLEDALRCIITLSQSGHSAEIVEKSLKYLLFLLPAEKLFDVALGMYELPLALSIGRRSQKDPKDFVPFLEELAKLPELERKFKINDHLQRFSEALKFLQLNSTVGDEQFLSYMQKYQLYKEAVGLTASTSERYEQVMNAFGEYLCSVNEPLSAVGCFRRAKNWIRLRDAAILSGEWSQLLQAEMNNCSVEESHKLAMISKLKSQGRGREAVMFAELSGLSKEIQFTTAVENGLFADASLLATLDNEDHLNQLENAMQLHGQRLLEKIQEQSASCADKSVRILRLQELFLKSAVDLQNFNNSLVVHGKSGEDVNDNVSEMSFKTSNTTIKTRTTNSSRRSSKKAERNRLRDKPGSPHEREFLLYSLRDLFAQVHRINPDVKELLKSLILFARDDTLTLAKSISAAYGKLCDEIQVFTDEFKKLQVKRIDHFNGNREPIDEQGNLIENPLIDPLEAKFELPNDFNQNWNMKIL